MTDTEIKKESPSLEELSEKGAEQELDSELEQPEERDPISNYGWVCVACVFLINGHTWGLNSVGIPPWDKLAGTSLTCKILVLRSLPRPLPLVQQIPRSHAP
jgi:hypothetical protein